MVSIWMNQVRPMLIVRCVSKSPEVFVLTGSAIKMEAQTEDHTVSFSFDDEPDRTERWPDSAEHDALFAPDQRRVRQPADAARGPCGLAIRRTTPSRRWRSSR